MFKFGRHEVRFFFALTIVFLGFTVDNIFGMVSRDVVPVRVLEAWENFVLLATPFILVAGILPAGKGDILKWK